MRKLLSIPSALVLVLLLLPSTALAYKYDPSRKASRDPYAHSSYNSHILGDINFYKQPTRKPRYTSTAHPYKNPYPHKVTKEDLQKMEARIKSNYNNLKAPTGNYARRAFMPNK